jgi:hypothetical protein
MKTLNAFAAASMMVATVAAGAAVEVVEAAEAPYSFAVVGDLPYGTTQLGQFANRMDQLDSASNVQLAVHLGDITSGGDTGNCTDSYNARIRDGFNSFSGPFVYTPGDNEWADCLRAGTGAANPLTRLSAVRATFFPRPGTTLGGAPMAVTTQSGYPENVSFDRGGISIATVHLVGSNNDLTPWPGYSSATTAQKAEASARVNADISIMRDTFARAKRVGSRAVVLLTQADMFAGSGSTYRSAFQTFVQALASESLAFGRPVLLVNGDTHSYQSDKPLTSSTWKSFYGISTSVPNLSRVVVKGGTSEWLRVTVVSTSSVLQWQRVPFQ